MDADSSVTIYKTRIVAKGFRQVQGVDYDEIFLIRKLYEHTKSNSISMPQTYWRTS